LEIRQLRGRKSLYYVIQREIINSGAIFGLTCLNNISNFRVSFDEQVRVRAAGFFYWDISIIHHF